MKITGILTLAVLAPALVAAEGSKKPGDIKWNIAIDPHTADNIADAAWNCVHDFAKVEPKWACNPTNKIVLKYAAICSSGNINLLYDMVYKFCDMRAKAGKGELPPKRPYLKKTSANDTDTAVDMDMDLEFNNITIIGSDGEKIAKNIDLVDVKPGQSGVPRTDATVLAHTSSTQPATEEHQTVWITVTVSSTASSPSATSSNSSPAGQDGNPGGLETETSKDADRITIQIVHPCAKIAQDSDPYYEAPCFGVPSSDFTEDAECGHDAAAYGDLIARDAGAEKLPGFRCVKGQCRTQRSERPVLGGCSQDTFA